MGDQCWAPKRFEPGPQTIIKYDAFRCQSSGGHVACCRAGDICLEGGICKYGVVPDSGAKYYVAGCTDENFTDPSCNRHCFKSAWPEFTPLQGGDYACCLGPMGSSSPDCSQPTDETWSGPAPDDLKTLVAIPATPSADWEPQAASSSKQSAAAPSKNDPAPQAASKPSSKPRVKLPSKAAPQDSSDSSGPSDSSGSESLDQPAKSSSSPSSPSTITLHEAIPVSTPGVNAQAQATQSLGVPAAVPSVGGTSSDASINGASGSTSSSTNAGGLDPSSKIGLGVGIGIGLPMLLLMGAIVYLLLRRRRSSQSAKPLPPLPPLSDPFVSDPFPSEKSAAWSTRDFYATSKRPHSQALAPPTYDPRPKEMEAGLGHVQEMQGSPFVSELPGEYRIRR